MIKLPDGIDKAFQFEGDIKEIRSLGEGLINDTFFIETKGDAPDYILQRKNGNIFKDVPAMMENIQKVTSHLKKKIILRGGDPMREAMTVTPAVDGKLWYRDQEGEHWAACLFINDTVTHQSADSLNLVYQGGAGIGEFQSMLSDMKEPLENILPGFHEIDYRFMQWDETLNCDRAGRKSMVKEQIDWIENRRDEMTAFWKRVESGELPQRVSHNDTKISNILFDKNDDVLCVIDLDTVMNSVCLNDYGDAIRSYANTGLEDDKDLDNVGLNMEIFKAYTKGYLSKTKSFLTPIEMEHLGFYARFITYEQVLRFLMDYIDGDNYYKIKYQGHNLVRATAQYKLLTSIENNMLEMNDFIFNL